MRLWPFKSKPSKTFAAASPYRRLSYHNPRTGAGGPADKSLDGEFEQPAYYDYQLLHNIYVGSWAARSFVDIIPDDMVRKWRTYSGDQADDFREAEMMLDVRSRINTALKAARLYGSGFIVVMSTDAPLEMPLDPERVLPGQITSLKCFDVSDASVTDYERDIFLPGYGQPRIYRFSTRYDQMTVHTSRVFRFDGIKPLTDNGWRTGRHQDFGIPSLQPVLLSIFQDAAISRALAHLSQESSIPVLRIDGLRNAQKGKGDQDEISTDEIFGELNQFKSIYRLLALDSNDDFTRTGISFTGLPQLLDVFHKRLAAASGIPATRFLGESPGGLNATGESDMRNYAMLISSLQQSMLSHALSTLDLIVARNAGIAQPPEAEFSPIIEASAKDIADVSAAKVSTLAAAVAAQIIDEDEAREALKGDPLFDGVDLSEPAPAEEPLDLSTDEQTPTNTSAPESG